MNNLKLSVWLRRYVLIGCALMVVMLIGGLWSYHTAINQPGQGGWDTYRLREFARNFLPYVIFMLVLLVPWWRSGKVVRTIGSGVFVLFGALMAWVCFRVLQKGMFGFLPGYLFILTLFAAHAFWLFHPR
jgi:hypothetical protein